MRYYPTIPLITPPASWSPRKRAMYRELRNVSRAPRTRGGFYLWLSKAFKKEAAHA